MKKIYILTETFDFQGIPTTTIVGVSMNASTAQRMLQNEIDDNMQIQSSRRYQEGNGHFVDEYICLHAPSGGIYTVQLNECPTEYDWNVIDWSEF